jgi:hypothetical protein
MASGRRLPPPSRWPRGPPSSAVGTAFCLGLLGLVRGVRALRVFGWLVDVFEGALTSFAAMVEQARVMLRVCEARRMTYGSWGLLVLEPVSTLRGFGRFAGVFFLRTLEQTKTVERARLTRGTDLP